MSQLFDVHASSGDEDTTGSCTVGRRIPLAKPAIAHGQVQSTYLLHFYLQQDLPGIAASSTGLHTSGNRHRSIHSAPLQAITHINNANGPELTFHKKSKSNANSFISMAEGESSNVIYCVNGESMTPSATPGNNTPHSSAWNLLTNPMAQHSPPYTVEPDPVVISRFQRLNSWTGARHDAFTHHMEERYHRFRPSELENNELASSGRHPYQQQAEIRQQYGIEPKRGFTATMKQWLLINKSNRNHETIQLAVSCHVMNDEIIDRLHDIAIRPNSSDSIIRGPVPISEHRSCYRQQDPMTYPSDTANTPGACALGDYALNFDKPRPLHDDELLNGDIYTATLQDECMDLFRLGYNGLHRWFTTATSLFNCRSPQV